MESFLRICLLIIVAKAAVSYEFDLSESKKPDLKRLSRSTDETSSQQSECVKFTNCTSCVSSEYPCAWCIDNGRCTDNATQNCLNDLLITGKGQQSFRSGPSFCPSIVSATRSNEIPVSAGSKPFIRAKLKIDRLQFFMLSRFQCSFDIEGEQINVHATILGDSIYCESVVFEYSANTPNLTVPFNVMWGGHRALDNPENLHILIYRCNAYANTEENCEGLVSKFRCNWCPTLNSCETWDKCQASMSKENATHTDCNEFETCTPCVSANMSCNWCIDGDRCVSHMEPECRNDILVNGPSFCPRITNTSNGNILLIPAGANKSISAEVQLVGKFLMLAPLKCQFKIEDQLQMVDAQLLGNAIHCDSMEFQYKAQVSNVTAKFSIIWGNNKTLDNPNDIEVVIYRCSQMASHASACSTLPSKYNCAWCSTSDSCETRSHCRSINAKIGKPNCGEIESCTSCVTSKDPCSWCVEKHVCTDNTVEECRNDVLIGNVNQTRLSVWSGPNFCQRIVSLNGENKTLIPAGTEKFIKAKITIISEFIVQTRFKCQFNIEGRIQQVNAQLLADTVYCNAMEFQYTSKSPNISVPFAVLWGGSNAFDNPNKIEIVIYRCSEMANTSEECSKLSKKYACSWCAKNNACQLENQCL